MATTAAERAQMERAQAKVKELLEKAQARTRGKSVLGVVANINPLAAAVNWALSSEVDAQLAGVVQMAAHNFTKWSGDMRRWALQGANDAGKPYTVAEWLKYGERDLGKHLSEVAGAFLDTSLFVVATAATAANAAAAANALGEGAAAVNAALQQLPKVIANPWPTSVKVGLAVLGGTAVLATGGYFLAQLNALPFLPRRSAA